MYESKNLLGSNAKCPFYLSEFKKSVTCEGYENGMDCTLHKFNSDESKTRYVQRYCTKDKGYKECKLYKLINQKYEED